MKSLIHQSGFFLRIIVLFFLIYPYSLFPLSTDHLLQQYYAQIDIVSNNHIDVKKFITEFSPPLALLLELLIQFNSFDSHQKKIIASNPRMYNTFNSEISTIYIKDGNVIFRIVCADRMRKIIQEKQYRTINVPKKYVFLTEKNIVCIAEKIISTNNLPIIIGMENIIELIEFVDITGFADFSKNNIIIDKNNVMYFIDTEIRSFALHTLRKDFNLKCLQQYLLSNCQLFIVTDQARQYLKNSINFYQKNNSKRDKIISLCKELDDTRINYKRVQQWFREWNATQKNSDYLYYDLLEYDKYIT